MLLSILLACGDPVAEYTIPTKEESNWKKWENKGQQGPAVGEAIGKPPEDGQGENPVANPSSGDRPVVRTPSDNPEKCRPIASSEHVDPGDSGIRISGKVEPATSLQGPLLIEIVRDEQQDTSLYSVVCGVSESFEFFAPPDLENVYVVAFSDSDGNGPSEADPMGISPKLSIVDGEIALEPIQMAGSIQPLSLPFVMMDVAEPSQEVQQPMDGEMPSGEEEDLPPPVNRPLDEDSDQSADPPTTEPPVESKDGANGVEEGAPE